MLQVTEEEWRRERDEDKETMRDRRVKGREESFLYVSATRFLHDLMVHVVSQVWKGESSRG